MRQNIEKVIQEKSNQKWLIDRTIFLTAHGSRAYGTNTPTSDLDVKGICVPPKKYFHGFLNVFEQAQITGDPDVVIYDIRKFIKLAAECNPNICEVLFTDPDDWFRTTNTFQKIWDNREIFLSKKAKHTFSGYAVAQLKRIKTHKRWLLEPPTHKPTREEYDLSIEHKVSATDLGAFDSLEGTGHQFDENVMLVLAKEKRYQNALTEYNQYENWKATRNEKRSALEAEFGFDTKHGMHLVRLMRMCREILEGKGVIVKRPDAQELLEIRNGAWSYDQLIEWSEKQEEDLKELYETSTLQKSPDLNKIDDLCQEVVEMML